MEDYIIFSNDLEMSSNRLDGIELEKGIYSVSVVYALAGDSGYGMVTSGLEEDGLTHALDSNVVLLPYYKNAIDFPIYVNKKVSDV